MLNKSLFIGTFFLLFIGLSDYGYGCHRSDNDGPIPHRDKPCKDDGGGGNGGGDGLKANLTGGTFVLDLRLNEGNPLAVNLDKKGRIFTSGDDLSMTQQEDDGPLLLAADWNAVFQACKETMPSTLEIPMAIQFGNDWRIAANAGRILLRLFDARVEPAAEIDLYLFGDSLDYIDNPIPPDDGKISQFELNWWTIFGDSERGVHPPESCHREGELWFPSTLSICGKDVPVCPPPPPQ